MNEEAIILLLKAQNFTGLELLIENYGVCILRTVHSILSHGIEPNYWSDVENEIFYDIWRKIAQFDESKSSFTTWILLIARSRSLDKKRQLQKEKQQTDWEACSESLIDSPLAREHFLLLIDTLKEIDQRIFLLYYFYQLSPQEIADSVGLEKSAIYNHLSRGKTQLKKALQERMSHHGL